MNNKLFEIFPEELKVLMVEKKLATIKENKEKANVSIEFAFDRAKKLPLETRRNVLSALNHFFNVKNVTKEEKEIAYKKVIKKAEFFKLCTMAISKQYESYVLSSNSIESSIDSKIK